MPPWKVWATSCLTMSFERLEHHIKPRSYATTFAICLLSLTCKEAVAQGDESVRQEVHGEKSLQQNNNLQKRDHREITVIKRDYAFFCRHRPLGLNSRKPSQSLTFSYISLCNSCFMRMNSLSSHPEKRSWSHSSCKKEDQLSLFAWQINSGGEVLWTVNTPAKLGNENQEPEKQQVSSLKLFTCLFICLPSSWVR